MDEIHPSAVPNNYYFSQGIYLMSYKFVRYSQSLAKKNKKQTLFLNCDGADVSFFVMFCFCLLN